MTFREKYMSEMDSVTFSDGFEVRTANLMKMQRVENDRKDVTESISLMYFSLKVI